MKFLAGLTQAIEARNGIIYEQARISAVGHGRLVRLDMACGGRVVAADVVLATSGYTPNLGMLRGRILPLHLQVVATEPLDA